MRHRFTLVIEGPLLEDDVLDALFQAGCDDATFGSVDGVGFGDFNRSARSFIGAVRSAIKAVESVAGLSVTRVEPDDLVTMAEIAERLGRSREGIRLLIEGQRGPGDFPPPVSHLRSRSRLWRWVDVAGWAGLATPQQLREGRLVAALNAALELRRQKPQLARSERSLVNSLSG